MGFRVDACFARLQELARFHEVVSKKDTTNLVSSVREAHHVTGKHVGKLLQHPLQGTYLGVLVLFRHALPCA